MMETIIHSIYLLVMLYIIVDLFHTGWREASEKSGYAYKSFIGFLAVTLGLAFFGVVMIGLMVVFSLFQNSWNMIF